MLLGAGPSNGACDSGPALTAQLIDSATGEILDELPPSPRTLDDEVTHIVYGSGEV